jgi:uncharacterized membrane protein
MPAKGQENAMQTSIFLARLMGPVMLVIGLSLAINSKIYTGMSAEFVASRPLVYLTGAFALTLGVSLLLNHNVWAADWRIIITLFGWFATINGVLRLMFPDWVRRIGPNTFKTEKPVFVSGIVAAVLGAIVCIAGYSH